VDLSGWVDVGLGGNCDCRCGILYASVLGRGGRGLWESHIFIVVFLTEFTSPYTWICTLEDLKMTQKESKHVVLK